MHPELPPHLTSHNSSTRLGRNNSSLTLTIWCGALNIEADNSFGSHGPSHRRTSPRRRLRAASRGRRGRPRDAGRRRQRARGDGRDGGDDRGRLSAHEPHRRRRLLAGARAVRAACARMMAAGPAGAKATPRVLSRARLRRNPAARAARGAHRAGRGRRLDAGAGGRARRIGGRLPLDVLLGAAISHAREGYAVTRSQARLTSREAAECKDAPGFADDVPRRRQAAGRGRDAEAERARRDARSTRQCGARRFLSRRRRARDRRRSGAHRQPGDARRS